MAQQRPTKPYKPGTVLYAKKPRWKPVRVLLWISYLGAAASIVYYGPQALSARLSEPSSPARASWPDPPGKDDLTDDNLWTNSAAVDSGWTLEIAWDGLFSSIRQNLLQDPDTVKSYTKFLSFFRNPKVAEFVRDYGANCNPDQHLFTWRFSAYYSYSYGFGSDMMTSLSTFVLADEPKVRATHRFQFVEKGWFYAFLPNFFKDLGATKNCSFFLDADRSGKVTHLSARVGFSKKNGVYIEEGKDVMMHHASVSWKRMNLAFTQLACRDGADVIFKKKSVIAKAVWQPVKALEDLLFLLWRQLADADGRYIGIQIGRGDKTGTEKDNVPVASIMRELSEICPSPCRQKLFVVTDEAWSSEALLNLTADPSYDMVNLNSLLTNIGLSAADYAVSFPKPEREVPQADRRFWTTSTKQLVLEITMLAMGDQIICTMTSNVCQLAALLKGSYERNVHSLDLPWESVLF